MDYYNRPPIPTDVRTKVLLRSRGCCEDCGQKTNNLELHHLTYQREVRCKLDVGEFIFGYETESDLVALCRECHHQQHIDVYGYFDGDIDEVTSGWDSFNHLAEKDD